MKGLTLPHLWNFCLLFLIGALFSCAAPSMRATFEDGTSMTFPDYYRKKALEYEKDGDLYRSIQSWEIVRSLQSGDQEAEKKIEGLREKMKTLANEHFKKGVSYYKNNNVEASQKEFLLALRYNPDHTEALHYLKERVAGESYRLYEVKRGDTLKEIARQIYNDAQKDFLIAYMNDLSRETRLTPGTTLRLPLLESIPKKKEKETVTTKPQTAQKTTYIKEIPFDMQEMLGKALAYLKNKNYQEAISATEKILEYDPTNRDALNVNNSAFFQMGKMYLERKRYQEALDIFSNLEPEYKDVKESLAFVKRELADEHYLRGIKYFTDEELDKAIKEWGETLALNPNHPKAKEDIENARGLLQRLKQYK